MFLKLKYEADHRQINTNQTEKPNDMLQFIHTTLLLSLLFAAYLFVFVLQLTPNYRFVHYIVCSSQLNIENNAKCLQFYYLYQYCLLPNLLRCYPPS